MKTKAQVKSERIIIVLIDLSAGDHAIKFVAHRGYDRLLCCHVYSGSCKNCPQYDCDRRSV